MKLVERDGDAVLVCENHLLPSDRVMREVGYAIRCEDCSGATVARLALGICAAEARLAGHLERLKQLAH